MATSLACAFFFYAEPVGETSLPALDACALCAKPLARDSDIFMYRGDTPFCSEECRYEQMQPDAIRARKAARSAGRRQQYSQRTESPRGHQDSRKVSVAS
ncbi:FCS-Like Zinc finger 1-like [Phragmites australis]|uniref:FCS-Like Zinc finger 1-like n=1 Tax=Phragmites australis TaxID=29695 RepID=UPI002D772F72|nr:FCS-Like Zinc finger 1-like [Phragmites australis]